MADRSIELVGPEGLDIVATAYGPLVSGDQDAAFAQINAGMPGDMVSTADVMDSNPLENSVGWSVMLGGNSTQGQPYDELALPGARFSIDMPMIAIVEATELQGEMVPAVDLMDGNMVQNQSGKTGMLTPESSPKPPVKFTLRTNT